MGVVSINLDLEVETWFRGIKNQGRSAVVNRVLRNHIRSKLGDAEATPAQELSPKQLIWLAMTKHRSEEWDMDKMRRLNAFRDALLHEIEKVEE